MHAVTLFFTMDDNPLSSKVKIHEFLLFKKQSVVFKNVCSTVRHFGFKSQPHSCDLRHVFQFFYMQNMHMNNTSLVWCQWET